MADEWIVMIDSVTVIWPEASSVILLMDLAPDSGGSRPGSVRSTSAIARWASADYAYRGWRETDVTGQLGRRQCEFRTGLHFMLDDLMGRCPSGGGHGVSAGGTTC